jgi:hypothetical protein
LLPKGSPSEVVPIIKPSIDKKSIKNKLIILKGLITSVETLGETQRRAINQLKDRIYVYPGISEDQLANLDKNLTKILDDKNGIVSGKYPHMALDNGLLKKKSTFGYVSDAFRTEIELQNALVKTYYLRGGKTKKHNKLQKNRNNRKTNKK